MATEETEAIGGARPIGATEGGDAFDATRRGLLGHPSGPGRRIARGLWAGALLLGLVGATTGCLTGFVYTHTLTPLDTQFDATPAHIEDVGVRRPIESWKTLAIPLVAAPGRLQFDWGDASIGRAVEEVGLERVDYADLEVLSILGIWKQRWVHVYGPVRRP